MSISIHQVEDKTLCPDCNFRDYYCEATLYGVCDCCGCRQDLCKPADRNKVASPLKLVA